MAEKWTDIGNSRDTNEDFVDYDIQKDYGFYIVGEHSIKITQNLLGIKGAKLEDITCLYSHEQGLQQSSKFLNDHPKIKAYNYSNTAAAANLQQMVR